MPQKQFTLFVLILSVCLTQMAIDIYAPALPNIARELNIPIDYAQFSMAIFMFGAGFSQLYYGPLSEVIGRKIPLIIGQTIMILGSLICLIPNIYLIILGRLIQGCGAGACACLWRAIFRDQFSGKDLAIYSSYLVTFIMFIIPAAPVVGGYLNEFYGWQGSFLFLTFYSICALLSIVFGFKETYKNNHFLKLSFQNICTNYLSLLKSPTFMAGSIGASLSYGASFSWFVIGPEILIKNMEITPIAFGWLNFFCGGLTYAVASYLNSKIIKKINIIYALRFGWSLMLLSGILLAGVGLSSQLSIIGIMMPLTLFFFGSSFIWPSTYATAFTPFGNIAGYAGALYGFLQTVGAALFGSIIAYVSETNPLVYAFVIIICTLSAWFLYELLVRKE